MTAANDQGLFRWSDGKIVLLIERDGEQWTISRGWLSGDRLEDIRRWRFDSERRLIGQIRRLVRESTVDHVRADQAANDLQRWLSVQPPDDGESLHAE